MKTIKSWMPGALKIFPDLWSQFGFPNLKTIASMVDRSWRPNVYTYNATISACERGGKHDKSWVFWGGWVEPVDSFWDVRDSTCLKQTEIVSPGQANNDSSSDGFSRNMGYRMLYTTPFESFLLNRQIQPWITSSSCWVLLNIIHATKNKDLRKNLLLAWLCAILYLREILSHYQGGGQKHFILPKMHSIYKMIGKRKCKNTTAHISTYFDHVGGIKQFTEKCKKYQRTQHDLQRRYQIITITWKPKRSTMGNGIGHPGEHGRSDLDATCW